MQASGLSPQGCGEFPPPPPMGRVGVAGPPAERVTVTVMTPGRVGVGWPGRGVLTTGLLPTLAHLPLTHPNWPSQSFSVWHVAPACAQDMSVTDLDTPPSVRGIHTKAVAGPLAVSRCWCRARPGGGTECGPRGGSGCSSGGGSGGGSDGWSRCGGRGAAGDGSAFSVDASQLAVAVVLSLASGALKSLLAPKHTQSKNETYQRSGRTTRKCQSFPLPLLHLLGREALSLDLPLRHHHHPILLHPILRRHRRLRAVGQLAHGCWSQERARPGQWTQRPEQREGSKPS